MITKLPMTTRELYSSVGLSSLDLAKVGNSEFVWAVAAFTNKLEKPVATFSDFGCALNLVKRLNAFVEGGVGLRPVLKTSNHLDTDKYKRLAEIGLTPYLIQLNDSGDVIQLVDNLGDDLDELSVDKLLHDLNKMDTTVRHNNTGNNLLGTFWAPNGHLAIKKARLFMAVLSSLIEKAES